MPQAGVAMGMALLVAERYPALEGELIAVAVTGIAGPGGSEHKPEGRVCFGLAQGGRALTETKEFGAIGRAGVRAATVRHALAMVLAATFQRGGS